MDRRIELHEKLCRILETALDPPPPNVRARVYFQPPESLRMTYPCIVYARTGIAVQFADNRSYKRRHEYSVIVIDPDPDSRIPDAVSEMKLTRFERHYVTENLNHDVFRIFY